MRDLGGSPRFHWAAPTLQVAPGDPRGSAVFLVGVEPWAASQSWALSTPPELRLGGRV